MSKVEIIQGNLFESECDILVNPVNCVGVMGAGLAKIFKERYAGTNMFDVYKFFCKYNEGVFFYAGGSVRYWESGSKHFPSVIFFPTKNHWKDKSSIIEIEFSLHSLSEYRLYSERSAAFPLLGCGLGGLNKDEVLPLMVKYLEKSSFKKVEIYV